MFSIIWLFVALVFSGVVDYQSAQSAHTITTVLLICSYALCIYYWVSSGNRILSLYNFFILYAFFSNAGQSLLYILGLPDEFLNVYGDGSLSSIVRMLVFQYLCVSALGVGCAYFLNQQKCPPITVALQNSTILKQNVVRKSYEPFFWVVLLSSFLYVLFYAIKMVVLRQSIDYGELYETRSEWNTTSYQFANLFVLLFCYYFLFRKLKTKIIYFILFIIIVCYMLSGSRGLAISFLCIFLIMLPITNPDLFKRKYYAVWIIGSIFFFSLLSVISSNRTSMLNDALNTEQNLLMNLYGTISEMGMSARTVTFTMDAIDQGNVDYHQTILYTLITSLVPFTNDLAILEEQYLPLATWVSHYAGSYTTGLGYSFIAEAYMNFGWWGWLFMLLYGWFIAYAEITAYRKILNGRYYWALCLLIILSRQVFYARAQIELIGGVLRLLEYLTIVFFILRSLYYTGNGADRPRKNNGY